MEQGPELGAERIEFGDIVGREQRFEQLLNRVVHAVRDRRGAAGTVVRSTLDGPYGRFCKRYIREKLESACERWRVPTRVAPRSLMSFLSFSSGAKKISVQQYKQRGSHGEL